MPKALTARPRPRSPGARTAAALLLPLAVALAACSASVITAPPAASGSSPGEPSAAGSTTNPTASATGGGLVPAGFPIMPNSTEDPDPPSVTGLIGAWHVEADSSSVYDFYVAQLPGAGFTVDGLFPGGAAAIITFRAPSGEPLQLSLEAAEGGGTDVQILADDPG